LYNFIVNILNYYKNYFIIQQNYAGFWIRLVARFIDWLILMSLAFVIILLPFFKHGIIPTYEQNVSISSLILILFWFIIAIVYDIYFIKKYNATPGKMIMRIKVIKVDNSNITWGDSILRWFIYRIGSGWWVLFLGALWVIWDKKKQGWHDKVANTLVIYNRN